MVALRDILPPVSSDGEAVRSRKPDEIIPCRCGAGPPALSAKVVAQKSRPNSAATGGSLRGNPVCNLNDAKGVVTRRNEICGSPTVLLPEKILVDDLNCRGVVTAQDIIKARARLISRSPPDARTSLVFTSDSADPTPSPGSRPSSARCPVPETTSRRRSSSRCNSPKKGQKVAGNLGQRSSKARAISKSFDDRLIEDMNFQHEAMHGFPVQIDHIHQLASEAIETLADTHDPDSVKKIGTISLDFNGLLGLTTKDLPNELEQEKHASEQEHKLVHELEDLLNKMKQCQNNSLPIDSTEAGVDIDFDQIANMLSRYKERGEVRADRIDVRWLMYLTQEVHQIQGGPGDSMGQAHSTKEVQEQLQRRIKLQAQYDMLRSRYWRLGDNMKELKELRERKPSSKTTADKAEGNLSKKLESEFIYNFRQETTSLVNKARQRASEIRQETEELKRRRLELRAALRREMQVLLQSFKTWAAKERQELRRILKSRKAALENLSRKADSARRLDDELGRRIEVAKEELSQLCPSDEVRAQLHVEIDESTGILCEYASAERIAECAIDFAGTRDKALVPACVVKVYDELLRICATEPAPERRNHRSRESRNPYDFDAVNKLLISDSEERRSHVSISRMPRTSFTFDVLLAKVEVVLGDSNCKARLMSALRYVGSLLEDLKGDSQTQGLDIFERRFALETIFHCLVKLAYVIGGLERGCQLYSFQMSCRMSRLWTRALDTTITKMTADNVTDSLSVLTYSNTLLYISTSLNWFLTRARSILDESSLAMATCHNELDDILSLLGCTSGDHKVGNHNFVPTQAGAPYEEVPLLLATTCQKKHQDTGDRRSCQIASRMLESLRHVHRSITVQLCMKRWLRDALALPFSGESTRTYKATMKSHSMFYGMSSEQRGVLDEMGNHLNDFGTVMADTMHPVSPVHRASSLDGDADAGERGSEKMLSMNPFALQVPSNLFGQVPELGANELGAKDAESTQTTQEDTKAPGEESKHKEVRVELIPLPPDADVRASEIKSLGTYKCGMDSFGTDARRRDSVDRQRRPTLLNVLRGLRKGNTVARAKNRMLQMSKVERTAAAMLDNKQTVIQDFIARREMSQTLAAARSSLPPSEVVAIPKEPRRRSSIQAAEPEKNVSEPDLEGHGSEDSLLSQMLEGHHDPRRRHSRTSRHSHGPLASRSTRPPHDPPAEKHSAPLHEVPQPREVDTVGQTQGIPIDILLKTRVKASRWRRLQQNNAGDIVPIERQPQLARESGKRPHCLKSGGRVFRGCVAAAMRAQMTTPTDMHVQSSGMQPGVALTAKLHMRVRRDSEPDAGGHAGNSRRRGSAPATSSRRSSLHDAGTVENIHDESTSSVGSLDEFVNHVNRNGAVTSVTKDENEVHPATKHYDHYDAVAANEEHPLSSQNEKELGNVAKQEFEYSVKESAIDSVPASGSNLVVGEQEKGVQVHHKHPSLTSEVERLDVPTLDWLSYSSVQEDPPNELTPSQKVPISKAVLLGALKAAGWKHVVNSPHQIPEKCDTERRPPLPSKPCDGFQKQEEVSVQNAAEPIAETTSVGNKSSSTAQTESENQDRALLSHIELAASYLEQSREGTSPTFTNLSGRSSPSLPPRNSGTVHLEQGSGAYNDKEEFQGLHEFTKGSYRFDRDHPMKVQRELTAVTEDSADGDERDDEFLTSEESSTDPEMQYMASVPPSPRKMSSRATTKDKEVLQPDIFQQQQPPVAAIDSKVTTCMASTKRMRTQEGNLWYMGRLGPVYNFVEARKLPRVTAMKPTMQDVVTPPPLDESCPCPSGGNEFTWEDFQVTRPASARDSPHLRPLLSPTALAGAFPAGQGMRCVDRTPSPTTIRTWLPAGVAPQSFEAVRR